MYAPSKGVPVEVGVGVSVGVEVDVGDGVEVDVGDGVGVDVGVGEEVVVVVVWVGVGFGLPSVFGEPLTWEVPPPSSVPSVSSSPPSVVVPPQPARLPIIPELTSINTERRSMESGKFFVAINPMEP